MSVNLQLLALQAIPRLAERFNVELEEFSTFTDLYGATPEEFQKAFEDCGKLLDHFFKEFHISWWDVYLNSDIGMERMALTTDIDLDKGDTVLDVGCGRGYFTVAAAKISRKVIGIDLMNGQGRVGWWSNYRETIAKLKLEPKVLGLKADAQKIPLREGSVTKAVAAHSVRDFQDKEIIRNSIREMNRVVSKGGEIAIVESMPIAKNKSQEAHLAIFECRRKYTHYELMYFTQKELLDVFREVGIKQVQTKIVDHNLSATPPIFCLNTSLLEKEQVEKAKREYSKALSLIKKHGENSPPSLIVKATKHV